MAIGVFFSPLPYAPVPIFCTLWNKLVCEKCFFSLQQCVHVCVLFLGYGHQSGMKGKRPVELTLLYLEC